MEIVKDILNIIIIGDFNIMVTNIAEPGLSTSNTEVSDNGLHKKSGRPPIGKESQRSYKTVVYLYRDEHKKLEDIARLKKKSRSDIIRNTWLESSK